jgi:hypothetical protein
MNDNSERIKRVKPLRYGRRENQDRNFYNKKKTEREREATSLQYRRAFMVSYPLPWRKSLKEIEVNGKLPISIK